MVEIDDQFSRGGLRSVVCRPGFQQAAMHRKQPLGFFGPGMYFMSAIGFGLSVWSLNRTLRDRSELSPLFFFRIGYAAFCLDSSFPLRLCDEDRSAEISLMLNEVLLLRVGDYSGLCLTGELWSLFIR